MDRLFAWFPFLRAFLNPKSPAVDPYMADYPDPKPFSIRAAA